MYRLPLIIAVAISTFTALSKDPVMVARAWVIVPMFVCTALIVLAIERER